MESASSILSRIKDHCRGHGVDYENELLSLDTRKNGIITSISFQRWLGSIGMNLTNHNIQALTMTYQSGADSVDIHKIISNIKSSSSYTQTLSEKPVQCVTELNEIVLHLQKTRESVRGTLNQYDRQNTGKVNQTSFFRSFGESPSMRRVWDSYSTNGLLDYLRLENDIKNLSKTGILVGQLSPTKVGDLTSPSYIKLASHVKRINIDYKQTFSQLDKLNTGKLDLMQFYSALSSFGANLFPYQYSEIANQFLIKPEGKQCDYKLFVSSLDDFVPPPPKALENSYSHTFDPHSLIESARLTVLDRRIDINSYFENFRKENPGNRTMNFNLFSRIISTIKIELSPEEIECVSTLFSHNGMIDFEAFISAVGIPSTAREVTSADVLPRLKAHLFETNQTLVPHAHRFDRENSGEVSVQQFISILNFVHFEATNQEIAAIRDDFKGEKNKNSIQWISIAKIVDPPPPQQQQQQQSQSQSPIQSQQQQKERALPPPQIAAIITKIYNSSATKGDNDLFLDLRLEDRLHRGTVSQQSFANFLLALPVRLSHSEVMTVAQYYKVAASSSLSSVSSSSSLDVNYLDLSRDAIKVIEEQKNAEKQALLSSNSFSSGRTLPKPVIPNEVHQFIQRYKIYAMQKKIASTEDIFYPYDSSSSSSRGGSGYNTSGGFSNSGGYSNSGSGFSNVNNNNSKGSYGSNRSGMVPAHCVQACFNNFGFQTRREEINQIVEIFKDTRKGEMFNYVSFSRAVNEEDISSLLASASTTIQINEPLSADAERIAETACSQIREKLLVRHRRIETAFAEIQKMFITTEDFQRRITSYDIVLTANQINALLRKYRVNMSDDIDFKRFIVDVNGTKTI